MICVLSDVTFRYSDKMPLLFENLDFGVDLNSRSENQYIKHMTLSIGLI